MGLFSKRSPSGAKAFAKQPRSDRAIVFFAEDGSSWPHFEPIIEELIGPMQQVVSYLTASSSDPILELHRPNLHAFDVSATMARTFLLQTLDAGVFVATLPRLGISVFPRSKRADELGTKYVHVFHSMASTHMIYDADGFDNYDAVLCAGPYMVDEIRARERVVGLAPKVLVEHGYGRLDSIRNAVGASTSVTARHVNTRPVVLVAPSWGPTCMFETIGAEVVRALLADDFEVIARPHPETVKRNPHSIERLRSEFGHDGRFALETDVVSQASLHRSDIMVSDWSGAALEYAFGLDRPVVFIDVPRKVNNDNYLELGIEPFEVSVRDKIGSTVRPDDLAQLAGVIRGLIADPTGFAETIRDVRADSIFNLGTSALVAAKYLAHTAMPYLQRDTP